LNISTLDILLSNRVALSQSKVINFYDTFDKVQ